MHADALCPRCAPAVHPVAVSSIADSISNVCSITCGGGDLARPGRGPAAPGHPYGRRVLAAELAALGRATPGHRNRTLNRSAFKVYHYVASGVLNDKDVTDAFTQTALAIGLDPTEVGRTLASARTAGLANPRSGPAGLNPDQEGA
jgi:hypothetical protein